jgi:uncharacterized RDD family membrane protein YckC
MTIRPARTRTLPASRLYDGVPLRRGLAWLIDMVIIGVLSALILPFTAFTGIFFFPFLMLVVGFLYRWGSIAAASATWGMAVTGIRLRDSHAQDLGAGLAFAHTLGYSLSVAIAPLQLISVVLMLVTARGQGLTDLLLGTEAVNARP